MFQVPVLFAFGLFTSPAVLLVLGIAIFVFVRLFLSKSSSGFSPPTSQAIFIGGLIMSVLGLLGSIFSAALIAGDSFHSYTPPFTDHEVSNIVKATGSSVILLIGVVMLAVYFVHKKQD
jgi:hypothetical protein